MFHSQICLGYNCKSGISHVLSEMCFKNHRNVKPPVIRQRAINVAAMRETLRAQDTQIWNHKCIIAWCKPQARTKTQASILHMHTCIWSLSLSAACVGLYGHYAQKQNNLCQNSTTRHLIIDCVLQLSSSSGWRCSMIHQFLENVRRICHASCLYFFFK